MAFLQKIIMFELVAGASLNFERKTCDTPSKC